MATVKKTYSRRNNEVSYLSDKDKENFDPFDELLSSPLKQEVQFKPLSFWGGNKQNLGCQKKSKTLKYGLFEASDSDNSPRNRKRKSKFKYSKRKGRTLPTKSNNDENNNVFSTTPFVIRSRCNRATAISMKSDVVKKPNKQSSDNVQHPITSQALTPTSKLCGGLKFANVRKQCSQGKRKNGSTRGSFQSFSKESVENHEKEVDKTSGLSSVNFEIYKESSMPVEGLGAEWEWHKLRCEQCEESGSLTLLVNESMEETLQPIINGHDDCKFITKKRHYNLKNFNCTLDSNASNENYESFNLSLNTLKRNASPQNLTFTLEEGRSIYSEKLGSTALYDGDDEEEEDSTICALSSNESGEIFSMSSLSGLRDESGRDALMTDDEEDSMSSTFCGSESMEKRYLSVDESCLSCEETKTISANGLLCENTALDESDFPLTNISKVDDLTQHLFLEKTESSLVGADESISASDENSVFLTDEESVIRVGERTCTKDAHRRGCADESELRHLEPPSAEMSLLTNEMSYLTIKQGDECRGSEESEELKDAKDKSVLIDLRNVTTKRKYRVGGVFERGISRVEEAESEKNPREDIEAEGREAVEEAGATEWNVTTCFGKPIFESTRVVDVSTIETGSGRRTLNQSEQMKSLLEEGQTWRDHTYALKPGKKWLRTVSVLKQIRNGSVTSLNSSRVKGRKFESFVRDVVEMQNGKPGWSSSLVDLTNSNDASVDSSERTSLTRSVSNRKSGLGWVNSLENISLSNSVLSASSSEKTVLETSLINPTIKIIPSEEKTSAFGLEISNIRFEDECSLKDKSSSLSARDFILLQCGQEDVLPFEEHFNERTLKDCKKIGEGVYGEVFKCSDAVIKIIPIEGADKVNGEPQKKFDEILSEVVIALKLSKLREGEKNRSDGFCLVKRCWCVQGRYPEYLLRLWEEYDQTGSGSENDSPVMFNEDQLYIILELANGGKDLESFVFTSSAQSLSVFVQTAFSLAAAERAFEFEHRDLHWGNVLISPTKEKSVTVVVDGVEYEVPSKGVKACIIDFTLSRMYDEGFCIFNDLSVDPSLFQSEGDYQFEIYKMMLREVRNDWSLFRPKTNIFWLHYTLDKMIHMVRYKNKKAKLHKKHEGELRILESIILDYRDSSSFASSEYVSGVMRRLKATS